MLLRATCVAELGTGASPVSPRRRRLNRQIQHSKELARQKQQQQQQQAQRPPDQQQQPARRQGGGGTDGSSLSLQCPHFTACSGCSLDTGLQQPPVLSEAEQFFEHTCNFASFQLTVGNAQQWRQRARLAVRQGPDGKAVIGLFQEKSHDVTAITSCV